MRTLACLLPWFCASLVMGGCASTDSVSDGSGDTADLSFKIRPKHDLANPPEPDLAQPDDAAPGGNDGPPATDDSGTTAGADMTMTMLPGPDLAMTMNPVDMAMTMLPSPDLAGMKPADMAGVKPADMATAAPLDMAGIKPTDMAGIKPADLAMAIGSDGGVACHPILNEFQTGSKQSASEEFIEIYNPCMVDFDLTNWSVAYRAGTNVAGPDAANDGNGGFTITAGTIKAGLYVTFCTDVFKANGSKCDGSYGAIGFMKDGVGALGLRDPKNALVDSLGYENANNLINLMNAFIQKTPAPAPLNCNSPGCSTGRLPNGASTGDNGADFKNTTAITPDAANK